MPETILRVKIPIGILDLGWDLVPMVQVGVLVSVMVIHTGTIHSIPGIILIIRMVFMDGTIRFIPGIIHGTDHGITEDCITLLITMIYINIVVILSMEFWMVEELLMVPAEEV